MNKIKKVVKGVISTYKNMSWKDVVSIYRNISWKEYVYSVGVYLIIAVPIFVFWNLAEIYILGYRNPNRRDSFIFLVITLGIYFYTLLKFSYDDFIKFANDKKAQLNK